MEIHPAAVAQAGPGASGAGPKSKTSILCKFGRAAKCGQQEPPGTAEISTEATLVFAGWRPSGC